MKFRRLLLLSISIMFVYACTDVYAQKKVVEKAAVKAIKKGFKKHSDDAAELVGKTHLRYKKDFTKNLKKSLKKNKVKSLVQLSRKNNVHVIGRPSELKTSRGLMSRGFNKHYLHSLEHPGKAKAMVPAGKIVYEYGGKEYLAPTGKEALKVVWDPKRKCPTRLYRPYSENANKVNKEYNRILLREQRKAISPYHQFPTIEQIKNYDNSLMILGKEPSGAVLRENLYRAMDKDAHMISWAFGGNAAHHVVEGKDAAALASRKILKKYKIDINAPENGILLPSPNNSIYKGAVHKTGHTARYSEYVHSKLKKAKSKDDCIKILSEIKHELYDGKLSLEGPLQKVNKNIR